MINKKYLIPLITLCLTQLSLFCQVDGIVMDDNTRLFSIETSKDTIEFIKIDTTIQFKRPVFIMLQGSLPIPLMIQSPGQNQYTSFPYSTTEIEKTHHVINISMPHIPVLVEWDKIEPDGRIKNPSPKYNKNNYLDNYVRRTNTVIDFLVTQKWVDTSQIVLFGHSQGSYVAIKTARYNSAVTHIAVSSFNPAGRMSGQIQKLRALENSGLMAPEEAQQRITDLYSRWAHIVKNADDDTALRGDTFKATASFSEDFTDDIMALDQSLYIMYGSKDYGVLATDMLPVELERAGKENYQIAVYPGLGHNYEEIDENGQSDYSKMHWQLAFNSFLEWLRQATK